MEKYWPKKRFGQNFLRDAYFAEKIVEAAEIAAADTVLEIGPGQGVLTKLLAGRAGKVLAVELDHDLIPGLKSQFRDCPNVEIINEDILRFLDSPPIPYTLHPIPSALKVVGSIPYQITSPLIYKLLNQSDPVESITILIQREVAEKILTLPPKATYLSNFVRFFADVKLITKVPKGAFFPVPKVDGAIILLKSHHREAGSRPLAGKVKIAAGDWSRFLHRGFAHPRQMLNKSFPPAVLKSVGVDPTRRPGTLTLDEWCSLFQNETGTILSKVGPFQGPTFKDYE